YQTVDVNGRSDSPTDDRDGTTTRAAARTAPALAPSHHRTARLDGNRGPRIDRLRTIRPRALTTTIDATVAAGERMPSQASTVQTIDVVSRLAPTARPIRPSGVEAPGAMTGPRASPGTTKITASATPAWSTAAE